MIAFFEVFNRTSINIEKLTFKFKSTHLFKGEKGQLKTTLINIDRVSVRSQCAIARVVARLSTLGGREGNRKYFLNFEENLKNIRKFTISS